MLHTWLIQYYQDTEEEDKSMFKLSYRSSLPNIN